MFELLLVILCLTGLLGALAVAAYRENSGDAPQSPGLRRHSHN